MSRIALIGAAAAALLLGGCSYGTESSFLGYRSSASFSTPGAAPPATYAAPSAYSEAPPAYAAPPPPPYPVYAPAPVYYGPTIGIGIGRWWGWRRRW